MNSAFSAENSASTSAAFMNKLKKPISTTLHTVLPNFEPKAREVFDKIVDLSSAVVVLNKTTRELVKSYGVPSEKIKLIPHGCPDVPLVPSSKAKPSLGLAGQGCDVVFWSSEQRQRNRVRHRSSSRHNQEGTQNSLLRFRRHASPSEENGGGSIPQHADAESQEPWAERPREVSEQVPLQSPN